MRFGINRILQIFIAPKCNFRVVIGRSVWMSSAPWRTLKRSENVKQDKISETKVSWDMGVKYFISILSYETVDILNLYKWQENLK